MSQERTPSPWDKEPVELGKQMSPEATEQAEQELASELLKEEALAERILEKLSQRGDEHRAYVRYPQDKSGFVSIGTMIGGHYSLNEQGFTVWIAAWERDPEWPRTNVYGIKQSRHFGPIGEPATLEGIVTALRLVRQAFPEYTEELWWPTSLPVDIAVELDILGRD